APKSVKMILENLLGDTADGGHVRKLHQISAAGWRNLDLTSLTYLMSVVNCTPDSFSDGGVSLVPKDAVRNLLEHVGGRSNRYCTDDAGDWDAPVAPPGGLPNQHCNFSRSNQGWGNNFEQLCGTTLRG
ncbi:hypothetical protein VP01_4655g2, partial [Puccinia sorghi]